MLVYIAPSLNPQGGIPPHGAFLGCHEGQYELVKKKNTSWYTENYINGYQCIFVEKQLRPKCECVFIKVNWVYP